MVPPLMLVPEPAGSASGGRSEALRCAVGPAAGPGIRITSGAGREMYTNEPPVQGRLACFPLGVTLASAVNLRIRNAGADPVRRGGCGILCGASRKSPCRSLWQDLHIDTQERPGRLQGGLGRPVPGYIGYERCASAAELPHFHAEHADGSRWPDCRNLAEDAVERCPTTAAAYLQDGRTPLASPLRRCIIGRWITLRTAAAMRGLVPEDLTQN